ncbi:LutB/LldF family L-lactate oxidation iron-sulfur protein [Thalassobaculum litoreum]|uniref:L-lactate dehydrogenase complex protein LldF n=1 Tax=Thalassobaculum litoreum DSM 18839 TaxID=1123362 RepID=A0A8G2F2Y6_9PROT|nr:LutB/LldF family L-lactate oxidation iron-sulfur protein [Thalassobaculum litoreum]SDF73133.1 L-lactate dehydrogenase complex protein LldF [Thalassobaculum litoreum DSM 18839]
MQSTSRNFKDNAHKALNDATLQRALLNVKSGFQENRARTVAGLPEFERLRDAGRDIKNHVLANLDFYLERFEENVTANGGHVHWCRTPAEAREKILEICKRREAKTVTKGKSMVAEEIGLNDYLEENGVEPIETDLGEYIIQLRHEPPSHIIAPAIHVTREQIAVDFRREHSDLDPNRRLEEPRDFTDEARAKLRDKYFAADVGITGANFLIAETGSTVIVTNEGNGDMTQLLGKAHVVIASLEKIVPTLEDASTILRLLARSATGQEMSVYTSFSTGPRRSEDRDGPEEFHVVLLDNGRSAMLGTEFQDMLRCIRCAACMNHCPVYEAVGGHAYGWVYPGPMGSVLTPSLIGVEEAGHLPNASTFCGRCESVCPMRIPLPKMMRHYRQREFEKGLSPQKARAGLSVWSYVATRPKLYRLATRLASGLLGRLGKVKGRLTTLPLAGGWTSVRDMPAPEGKTFHDLYRDRQAAKGGRE